MADPEEGDLDPDLWSVQSLLDAEFDPPRRWLGAFMFESCRAMLSGATGIGKTRWLLGCCKAILRGQSFATFDPDPDSLPPRILYLDYELGILGMKDILIPMSPWPPGMSVVCFDSPRLGGDGFLPLDRERGQTQVSSLITSTQSTLVVIDNLYSACMDGLLGGSEVNTAHKGLAEYLKLLSRNHVASLCAHHAGNDKTRAYGDSRLTWASTGHLHIEGKEHAREGEFRVMVRSHKLRYGKALAPQDMVCDVATGEWGMVGGRAQGRPRPNAGAWHEWLRHTALKLLEISSPHSIIPLRDAFFEEFCKDCGPSTARSRWKRLQDASMQQLEVDGEFFTWVEQDLPRGEG